MVLVTGPTVRGQTNTCMRGGETREQSGYQIMNRGRSVEFQVGRNQTVQMKEQIGLNFAALARLFAEDRTLFWLEKFADFETAEIAVKRRSRSLVLSTRTHQRCDFKRTAVD